MSLSYSLWRGSHRPEAGYTPGWVVASPKAPINSAVSPFSREFTPAQVDSKVERLSLCSWVDPDEHFNESL